MSTFIQTLNGYLWGFPMIAFLFLTHIVMSSRTGFVQRKVFTGIRLSVTKSCEDQGEISPFSALATSLASTLGTGNIVGVGTAVALGGAGAVFWCWITGILGMATQYCECFLSVEYRVKTEDGGYSGGPMYVLEKGVGSRKMGVLYALLASVGGLITGAAIQSNAISNVIMAGIESREETHTCISVPLIVGVVAGLLTAMVIFGGLRLISRVCCFCVPFMAAAYMLGCVVILIINRAFLVEAVWLIVKEAFSFKAAAGGLTGSVFLVACRYGVARGLFSNEAGIGTSSVVSASAHTSSSVKQGLVSMTATFWDTVVMCLVTGVVIVSTLLTQSYDALQGAESGNLCYTAFCRIPVVGEGLLIFSMITFAFSTILGWSAVGERCITYIFGSKSRKWYRALWVAAVIAAPMVTLEGIWELGDLINGLLVVPNVWGLLMLSAKVRDKTKRELPYI